MPLTCMTSALAALLTALRTVVKERVAPTTRHLRGAIHCTQHTPAMMPYPCFHTRGLPTLQHPPPHFNSTWRSRGNPSPHARTFTAIQLKWTALGTLHLHPLSMQGCPMSIAQCGLQVGAMRAMPWCKQHMHQIHQQTARPACWRTLRQPPLA